jgi:DNA-directed RNA polymerase specialized sigma24 family protein
VSDPFEMAPEDLRRDENDWLFYQAVADAERETSPTHWKAFWMTAIEGMDASQVAKVLGVRLGTIYSIKSRVLANIKERIACLSQEHSEGGAS